MPIPRRKITSFRSAILAWYDANRRDLPWRRTTDPYRVLVAEVMLQQTQVDRVIPKYEAFLSRFPTLDALGKAELGEVLQVWQGLGYNRRAKMLWELARHPETRSLLYGNETESGPEDLAALERLPGVGHYTARALAAFAWNRDALAFDTNLRRVHERHFGKGYDARALAGEALPHGKARDWNNALMDFGSAVCTRTPRCEACPLRRGCAAYATGDFAVVVPKQGAFKGSNRYFRGAIIRALSAGPKARAALVIDGEEGRSADALAQLETEGLIVRDGRRFRLP
jgi:A/G-specific adenine glycosylase